MPKTLKNAPKADQGINIKKNVDFPGSHFYVKQILSDKFSLCANKVSAILARPQLTYKSRPSEVMAYWRLTAKREQQSRISCVIMKVNNILFRYDIAFSLFS